MRRKVELSQQAREEIEQAYLFIRQDAPQRARRWRERLLVAIRSLRDFPERYAVAITPSSAVRDVRQMTFGVYCVYYTIASDHVYVLTVRHSARRPIEPNELRQPD